MTPDDRADKIMNRILMLNTDVGDATFQILVDELKAAQAEAYEEAAKIAEHANDGFVPCQDQWISDRDGKWIAERIRAKAAELARKP